MYLKRVEQNRKVLRPVGFRITRILTDSMCPKTSPFRGLVRRDVWAKPVKFSMFQVQPILVGDDLELLDGGGEIPKSQEKS